MRPDPIIEFGLGLAAVLLALAAALLFAFPPSWLDSREEVVAVFANVGGLTEGASVRENGFIRGNVTAITPVFNHYEVHMKVPPGWAPPSGSALAVEQSNPLQAAGLSVARVCKLRASADKPAAGCCPDAARTGPALAAARLMASCGVSPTLVDVVMAVTVKASSDITALENTLPPLKNQTVAAITATTGAMTTMKSVSENALKIVDDRNKENLKAALAGAASGTKTMSEMLADKRADLEASIASLKEASATTSVRIPAILDNIQKTTEDLKAITAQIRNEPTSVLRKRTRRDPSFVEPGK